jgi:hypothetical protein
LSQLLVNLGGQIRGMPRSLRRSAVARRVFHLQRV